MENEGVIIAKYETLKKCMKRIEEEYEKNPDNLEDYRRLDGIVLNLQRACEAVIDIAFYVVSCHQLGIPQTKREAFDMLEKANIISHELASNMKGMIGFRNIAVHDYKEIDNDILRDVLDNHLSDLNEFVICILNHEDGTFDKGNGEV